MSDYLELAHQLLDFLPPNPQRIREIVDRMGGEDSPLSCAVFAYSNLPCCERRWSPPHNSTTSQDLDKFLFSLGVL